MRYVEKERKNFLFRIPFILDSGKKIPKKIEKEIKKLKNLFAALFLAKTGLDRPRKREKNLVSNSIHTRPGQENSENNRKRKQKTKKPLSGIIFSQKRIR